MARKAGVKKTSNWDQLRRILDANHMRGRLEKNMAIAAKANAELAERAIKQNILRGSYAKGRPPNARLTREIKRGRRPLVDSKQLWKSVVAVVQSPTRVEVGVLRSDPRAWIAVVNHEGITIPVTPAMRAMFRALAIASETGDDSKLSDRAKFLFGRKPDGWKPLKPSTAAIRIPSRPFIREVVEDVEFRELVARNWLRAAALGVADMPIKPSHLQKRP